MKAMPEVFMPDQRAAGYPAEYRFSAGTERVHLRLPFVLRRNWDSFGSGSVTEAPLNTPVRTVSEASRSQLKEYKELSVRLTEHFTDLQESDRRLVPQVRKSVVVANQGREKLERLIHTINNQAKTVPAVVMSEDDHVLGYVRSGLDSIEQIIGVASKSQKNLGSEISGLTRELQKMTERLTKADASGTRLPGHVAGRRPALPGAEQVRATVDTPSAPTTDRTGAPNAFAPSPVGLLASAGDVESTPQQAAPDTVRPDTSRPSMMHRAPDEDQATDGIDAQRSGEAQGFDASPPVAAPPPPSTAPPGTAPTPWTGRAVAGASPNHRASGSAGSTWSQALLRTDTDTDVVYSFPDGRRQEVPAIVAMALDAAFGSRLRTDARAAYARTSAKWSERATPGARINRRRLATGDVAMWDRRAAVLVVSAAEHGDTVEMVTDGLLRPFATAASDDRGEFGHFVAFFRPCGVDVTAPDTGGERHDAYGETAVAHTSVTPLPDPADRVEGRTAS